MPEIAERSWRSPDGLTLVADDYAPAAGPARAPVVCLHGLTRNARDFDLLAPHIAGTGRRVLALDMRGRSRSAYDPSPANYNPLVYAGDVIALMAQAGVSRAVFIGTSMGGLIAMTLAAMRPDLVAAAVLNDVGPELGKAGIARISAYVGRLPEAASWEEAEAIARNLNGQALPGLSNDDWARFARRIFRREGPGRLRLDYDPAISQAFKAAPAAAPGPPPPDLWPMFAGLALNRPLLLIRGETSDILEDGVAARMCAAAPLMKRIDIPGVGHAPTLDEPAAIDAIDDLLAEAP